MRMNLQKYRKLDAIYLGDKCIIKMAFPEHAKELVRRWNAFEEGGLVKELRKTLKYVLKRIEDSEEWWMDCPDKGGFDTEIIEAALAKS